MTRVWFVAGLCICGLGCGSGSGGESTAGASVGTGSASTTSGASESGTSTDKPTSGATSSAGSTASEPTSMGASSGSGSSSGGSGDTGAEGLQCPLAGGAGVSVLTLEPALFAEGADPSGTEACGIVNPERGFYQFVDLRDLDADTLDDAAANGMSVLYGQVLLPEFRDAPLDQGVLDDIAAGFDLVREHGMKVVPRFHYSDAIDEPDAELARILGHIEQLTPLLQLHSDVILTLQAGFIGAWGEWHSSQNGLDAPGPRKQVLDALLAALPASRTVSVRRPSFKMDAYGGPLTADTAYDGSDLARVGHINDCFLASDDDEGTYQLPGEKDYAVADSAFVPVGGETCAVNPPRSECPAALAELALHHWNHLNRGYHPDVIAGWQDGGCLDQIACRLGYRLALREIQWATTAAAGGSLPVSLRIFNDGFAAPVNARPLILAFDGPTPFEVLVEADAREWAPGAEAALCFDLALPESLQPGSYRLGLRLPDAGALTPRFSIRLVNGEWDEEWGINWFEAKVEVQ